MTKIGRDLSSLALFTLLVLAMSAPAHGATFNIQEGVVAVTSFQDVERFRATESNGKILFVRLPGGAPLSLLSNSGCTQEMAGESVSCPMPSKVIGLLGGGNDEVIFDVDVPVRMEGEDGDDRLIGGSSNDHLFGDEGQDYLKGSGGDDDLNGGEGLDSFDGLDGADGVSGGPRKDRIDLSNMAKPVFITLDSEYNDGPADNQTAYIAPDIEVVIGTPGNDTMIDAKGGHRLEGQGGNDTLSSVNGPGVSELMGGEGDDKLDALNGLADIVACEAGNDTARVDPIDDGYSGCEAVTMADDDGDGFNKQADCDDSNPSAHPGAIDIPNNAVDEDCNGRDELGLSILLPLGPDNDHDFSGVPEDCNDNNPDIRPGVYDLPGNGIDEDCSGADAARQRVAGAVDLKFKAKRKQGMKITYLRVTGVLPGTTIAVRCKGGGCPRSITAPPIDSDVGVTLTDQFRKRLRPTAVLEVELSTPHAIATVHRATVQRSGKPRMTSLCRSPGGQLAAC